jgi:transposase
VVNVAAPWAKPHGRFTLLFERLIIDVLKVTHTISGACVLLGITWDEGMAVMQRGVKRGQERKQPQTVKHIGVDEKAFRKGHSYMTIVCDLDTSTVQFITEDRKTSSLAEYFETRTDEQLLGIEAIAMDMWEPYVQATMEHVPLAKGKIVFDKFHIMKQMNEAVDKVRRSEHRSLKADGDDTLTGSKHLWLYAQENVPQKSQAKFDALREQSLRTGRAWSIKETLRGLWDYKSMGWGRRFFNKWFGWARRSALEPVKKAALTFKRHLDNILTYCVHGITNAAAESLNSRIMALKRISPGRRNKENFKTAVYFYHGGLDIYP